MMVQLPIGQKSNPKRTVKGLGLTASLMLFLSSPNSPQTWDQEHTFRIFEEDGVTIAETGGGPRYSGEIFRYERLMTLHEDESRPESLLGNPYVYNRMDEEGSVYVTDTQLNRVVCFDATGNYSHDIGGQGRGPGEYVSPRLLAVGDGIVTIYDRRLYRTSFFNNDGTFLESITSFRRRSLSLDEMQRGPGGELIFIESRMFQEGENAYRYETAVVTIYSAGEDTIASLSTERIKTDYMLGASYCWRVFGGHPRARYHPALGIVMTTGVEPKIEIFDLEGQLRRIIRLDTPPEPVTRDEKRAIDSGLRETMNQTKDEQMRATLRQRIPHIEITDPKAYWNEMIVDEHGYIWTGRPEYKYQLLTISITGQRPVDRYRVFSPEGEYLGDSTLPVRGGISRGHLIGRQDNEETGGIEMVIYRIVPAVPGLEYP